MIDTCTLKLKLIEALNLEDISPEEIDDQAPLFKEGLGLDSVDAIEIVLMLNNEFGVEMKNMDEAGDAFNSVAALAGYINRHAGR